MDKDEQKRCIQLPTGDRICTERDTTAPRIPRIGLKHAVLIGVGVLLLAFLTGLGLDIFALLFFAIGIILTGVAIWLAVLAFSYEVWIGIVFTIGAVVGLYFLWTVVVIPNWFTLGNSLVTAFENFVNIIAP